MHRNSYGDMPFATAEIDFFIVRQLSGSTQRNVLDVCPTSSVINRQTSVAVICHRINTRAENYAKFNQYIMYMCTGMV